MHIGPRVVNKEKFLRALKGARKPEDLLKRIGFATRRGADKHGKQVDWLVLDVVNETESAPSDLQKLRRIAKAIQAWLRCLKQFRGRDDGVELHAVVGPSM